jgi:hypothetical protein
MSEFIECHHILATGRKCQGAALAGKAFCRHHARLHFRTTVNGKPLKLSQTALDLHALTVAATRALEALSSPMVDTRRAGVLVSALNLAASLRKMNKAQLDSAPPAPTTDATGQTTSS